MTKLVLKNLLIPYAIILAPDI